MVRTKMGNFIRSIFPNTKERYKDDEEVKQQFMKVRNNSLRKLMFLHSVLNAGLLRESMDRPEFVKVTMKVLGCSKRMAYDYVNAYDFITSDIMGVMALMELKNLMSKSDNKSQ